MTPAKSKGRQRPFPIARGESGKVRWANKGGTEKLWVSVFQTASNPHGNANVADDSDADAAAAATAATTATTVAAPAILFHNCQHHKDHHLLVA